MADTCERCNRPKAAAEDWAALTDHGPCEGCEWGDSRCWGALDCEVRTELNTEKLARYEQALQRIADGALGPTVTAHPFTTIGRVARRLLEGAELEQALRELREDQRGQDR